MICIMTHGHTAYFLDRDDEHVDGSVFEESFPVDLFFLNACNSYANGIRGSIMGHLNVTCYIGWGGTDNTSQMGGFGLKFFEKLHDTGGGAPTIMQALVAAQNAYPAIGYDCYKYGDSSISLDRDGPY